MKIAFASLSNAGPRPINEDFLDCWTTETGETVACVADGLGGMGGGDVASKLAVTRFREKLLNGAGSESSMLEAAQSAHQAILDAQDSSTRNRMATTLTAVALRDDKLWGVHCGDSRAVIARGRGIKRLTTDHSEGQRLFEAGKISKEELADYPRKHILESALGHRDDPRIETFQFDLHPGDRVILTTDGVHNIVSLHQMQILASTSLGPDELVNRVATTIAEEGAADNYSLIALFA